MSFEKKRREKRRGNWKQIPLDGHVAAEKIPEELTTRRRPAESSTPPLPPPRSRPPARSFAVSPQGDTGWGGPGKLVSTDFPHLEVHWVFVNPEANGEGCPSPFFSARGLLHGQLRRPRNERNLGNIDELGEKFGALEEPLVGREDGPRRVLAFQAPVRA